MMFFVILEMPSKTFVMVRKKLPAHFKVGLKDWNEKIYIYPWTLPYLVILMHFIVVQRCQMAQGKGNLKPIIPG